MEKIIPVHFPTDERGLFGRKCPECKGYFKVKYGSGLPTPECICPYCGIRTAHDKFFTEDQIEYAKSIAFKEALGPALRDLQNTLKGLERSTQGGFVQFKVQTKDFDFPIRNYQEKELETHVKCNNCGLEFAIYGVFASCPDCGRLNALTIFLKSIEVSRKRLSLFDSLSLDDKDLRSAVLEDALSGGISSFDAFGKALRDEYPEKLPKKPKNLFQNLFELEASLSDLMGKSFPEIFGKDQYAFLAKMFQVRHIYQHSMGVVDDDFVKKIPAFSHLMGRKYPLSRDEIDMLLMSLGDLGKQISDLLEIYTGKA